MRFILTTFAILTVFTLSTAQILILPSDFYIKKQKNRFSAELSLYPMTRLLNESDAFNDRIKHYSKIMTDEMNSWMKNEISQAIIYDQNKHDIDIIKLKNSILREYGVYEGNDTKPLFGSSGNKPTEGVNTKTQLNEIREKYDIKYIVFAFANSIHSKDYVNKSHLPEYIGHSWFYGFVLDTKTGHIEIVVRSKDKEKPKLTKESQYYRPAYDPFFYKVDDKYVDKRCRKIQNKLSRKISSLE